MINAKKLIKVARTWQKLAALGRKRITLPQAISSINKSSCSTSSKAEKAHFVVYSADQRRFLLPLEYLNNKIFRELLKLAEEEFGLPSNGPLTLPCNSELIEFITASIKHTVSKDVETTILMSLASSCCSLSSDLHHQLSSHQLSICSF